MSYTKNYYAILGLEEPSSSPSSSSAGRQRTDSLCTADVRKAYKSALLSAHPDKTRSSTDKTTGGKDSKSKEEAHTYTIDDVKEAYFVLSDAGRRGAYEEWFLGRDSAGARSGTGGVGVGMGEFVLGLEVLDLSDFSAGEEGDGEAEWTRGCRCGDSMGFRIFESELEGAEGRGEREVLVGCGGCSLWVRVGFEVEV
ncbi:hypothetical protein P153DRAFT_307194, partial [Dothidotthia symphoricarpi CBS 119687]